MNDKYQYHNQTRKVQRIKSWSWFALPGFMNNIFSGKKYRASPERVSLMDNTNNLTSHLIRSSLIHSSGYGHFGHPDLCPMGQPYGCSNMLPAYLSADDGPACFARLPVKSKSFIQYAGK
jgi:hypothetical protein